MQLDIVIPKRFVMVPAVIVGLIAVGIGWLVGPIAQDPAYHAFADQRILIGIPYANDVLSNLPFSVFGLAGMYLAWRQRRRLGNYVPFFLTFFIGVFLTGVGSAYYHYDPSNATLVWDRLPMTIGFMSLLSLMLAERFRSGLALKLLPWLLLAGIGSVVYWDFIDDLRPYAVVQFGSLLVMSYLLIKHRRNGDRLWWFALGFYLLAKILEATDGPIFSLSGGWISGHSLKHLAASLAPLMILFKMRHEVPAEEIDANGTQVETRPD